MRSFALGALVGASLISSACAPANNFVEPAGPRFAGVVSSSRVPALRGDTVVVATFNIENGEEVEGALKVLAEHRNLREADLLLLQEVDAEATAEVAETLALNWVYYPARQRAGQGFGSAVLSPWPIVEDAKVILPHRSWFGGTQRTATMALVQVGELSVRVYSTHLATPVNQSPGDRQDQLQAVIDHAGDAPLVVIGGDLNSGSVGEVALDDGYVWPTREGPNTTFLDRVDHILFKGFRRITGSPETGTVMDNQGASDHRAVWALVLRPPT